MSDWAEKTTEEIAADLQTWKKALAASQDYPRRDPVVIKYPGGATLRIMPSCEPLYSHLAARLTQDA